MACRINNRETDVLDYKQAMCNRNEYQEHFLGVKVAGV
jgi:hypothetical protein